MKTRGGVHSRSASGCGYGWSLNKAVCPYSLALAMFLSILFPVRKVNTPIKNRYFRVENMF